MPAYESPQLSPEQLAELHALPDDALATAQEAAAFLRLKYGTLAWYRCQGGGPKFTRIGPKLIRYRMADLREYAKGQPSDRLLEVLLKFRYGDQMADRLRVKVEESSGLDAAALLKMPSEDRKALAELLAKYEANKERENGGS